MKRRGETINKSDEVKNVSSKIRAVSIEEENGLKQCITDVLPPEIFDIIFNHLHRANDRRRIACVCKMFHEVIRKLSKISGGYRLKLEDDSPVSVFNRPSIIFPFSKLFISFTPSSLGLFERFGEQITEITLCNKDSVIYDFLNDWRNFFPNLKTLELDSILNINPNLTTLKDHCHLPIETLIIKMRFNLDVLTILRFCSNLKRVVLDIMSLDPIVPFLRRLMQMEDVKTLLERLESFELGVNNVPLKDLLFVPSNVTFRLLSVSNEDSLDSIRDFFAKPRFIEYLRLNLTKSFARNKIDELMAAKKIKVLHMEGEHPDFEGSIDLLAQLPKLEEINFCASYCDEDLTPFFPHFWRQPETAKKIKTFRFEGMDTEPKCLTGLRFVETLKAHKIGDTGDEFISCGYDSYDIIEGIIDHCPNLKKFEIQNYNGGESSWTGSDGKSTLEKLEILTIRKAPFLAGAFEGFEYPNLRKFCVFSAGETYDLKDETIVSLIENCPNLEYLSVIESVITTEGFAKLVQGLKYLSSIEIAGTGHKIDKNDASIRNLMKEYPYIKANIFEEIFYYD